MPLVTTKENSEEHMRNRQQCVMTMMVMLMMMMMVMAVSGRLKKNATSFLSLFKCANKPTTSVGD